MVVIVTLDYALPSVVRHLSCGVLLFSAALAAQCASVPAGPGRAAVGSALAERTTVDPGDLKSPAAWTLPAGANLADGLTADEAVAAALWNNADFHAALTELGIARADLIEAGIIRNPILSLLLPLGPKQLEMTINWPVELWQRPRRIADARLNAEAAAAQLVAHGLRLIGDVRVAFVDVLAADRALAIGAEQAATARQLADLGAARLKAGDISELDARLLRTEAARLDAARLGRASARDLAMSRLRALIGLAPEAPAVRLTDAPQGPVPPCGDLPALITSALASRPDVRAAELLVEAAGERAGLERSRVVALTAILDANAEGREGFEMGPGLGLELPIASRNQGRRARAAAELDRASRRYIAVRAAVVAGVEQALASHNAARDIARVLTDDVSGSLARDHQQVQRMYELGEISLMSLLETRQRLIDVDLTRIDAEFAARRTAIRLDEAVGRTCRER
jgi:cobalt-zinc-cadmium efflux system outer membrane protein